jgi:uncharacterized protein (UPF0303 family)
MDLDTLVQQEKSLVFASFDHDDAWRLGCALRDRAARERLPVAVDIRTPQGVVLFHVSLPGATADQEDWARRKAAVVFRFDSSSAAAAERLGEPPWLDPAAYAVTGGSFPVRVAGAGVIAAVTVSGLKSEEDHDLVIQALTEALLEQ